jgi:hypothetical protein
MRRRGGPALLLVALSTLAMVAPTAAAEPVYDPGGYSAGLEVALVAGTWYAVTKVDDFFGSNLDILTAPRPTGPWTVGASFKVPAKPTRGRTRTTPA